MKWKSKFAHPENWKFEIEYEASVESYYLYVWDSSGNNTHDYDQDTLEMAQEHALEQFGVPVDSWVEAA